MKKRLRPGETPPGGEVQTREPDPRPGSAAEEQRRRRAVDQELAKKRPIDERVDGLTGKYIA